MCVDLFIFCFSTINHLSCVLIFPFLLLLFRFFRCLFRFMQTIAHSIHSNPFAPPTPIRSSFSVCVSSSTALSFQTRSLNLKCKRQPAANVLLEYWAPLNQVINLKLIAPFPAIYLWFSCCLSRALSALIDCANG